ncbi:MULTISPECIES: hypothetical protein [Planktothrix]|nr:MULTISPECIES: hypothetical protein [Planktothrix]
MGNGEWGITNYELRITNGEERILDFGFEYRFIEKTRQMWMK